MRDPWKAFLLLEDLSRDQVAVIDTVILNLRHPDLHPARWERLMTPGLDHPLVTGGPRFIFPGTDRKEREQIFAYGLAVELKACDTIRIVKVETVAQDAPYGELDHERHRQEKLAILEVAHREGGVTPVPHPICYRGVGATDSATPLTNQERLRGLVRRMEVMAGIGDIEELVDCDRQEWPSSARALRGIRADALNALVAFEEGDVEAGVVFGQLMERVDASDRLLGLALRKTHDARGSKRAGRIAGVKHHEKTLQKRRAALIFIAKWPTIGLGACAKRVVDDLIAQGGNAGTVKGVERAIRPLFEPIPGGIGLRPTVAAIEKAQTCADKFKGV